jgi:Asp-tRNA(Asn)/Glu-tRNA(Gln) amidotransferase A subunit family amidase
MTRTIEDLALVFQVIVGEDADDPMTSRARGRTIPDYRKALVRDGLKGARLGVLRDAYERPTTDSEIVQVFTRALDDLRAAGAEIVDGLTFERPQRTQGAGTCRGFKYDINEYLALRGVKSPVRNLDEIVASPVFGQFPTSVQSRLKAAQSSNPQGPGSEACKADVAYREAFGAALTRAMDDGRIDAFIYPTWSNPPRLIGDMESPAGDNNQVHSPTSGFPALNVPMGYTRNNTLPIGMTLLGRAWDEARLIRLAYAYEQATRHRRPPGIR